MRREYWIFVQLSSYRCRFSALKADLDLQGVTLGQLGVDRGYINSTLVDDAQTLGAEVVGNPWFARNSQTDMFKKTDCVYRSNVITGIGAW
jgi:hypothetical protein